MTPTASRILAISLAERLPLLTRKKSSHAVAAFVGCENSDLGETRWYVGQSLLMSSTKINEKIGSEDIKCR